SDPDGQALSAVKVTDPARGSLTLNPTGGFSYTSTAGYSGPDSFTYQASDGSLTSGAATVSIAVSAGGPGPDPNPGPGGGGPGGSGSSAAPTAGDNTYATAAQTPLNVPAPGVLANDTDPASLPL